MAFKKTSLHLLVRTFFYLCFLWLTFKTVMTQNDDVLHSYRVANRQQCERLCWYRKLCTKISFYSLDNETIGENCVLHVDMAVPAGPMTKGWTQDRASGDMLAAGHGCKPRPCGEMEICIPVLARNKTFICQPHPIECVEPPTIPKTLVTGSGRSPGDNVTLTCPKDYLWLPQSVTNNNITCLVTTSWSDPQATCRRVFWADGWLPKADVITELPVPGITAGWEVCINGTFLLNPMRLNLYNSASSNGALFFFFHGFHSNATIRYRMTWITINNGIPTGEQDIDEFVVIQNDPFMLCLKDMTPTSLRITVLGPPDHASNLMYNTLPAYVNISAFTHLKLFANCKIEYVNYTGPF